jgi:hypothetical protein
MTSMIRRQFLSNGRLFFLASILGLGDSVPKQGQLVVQTIYSQKGSDHFDFLQFKVFFENRYDSDKFNTIRENYIENGLILKFTKEVKANQFITTYHFSNYTVMKNFIKEAEATKRRLGGKGLFSASLYDFEARVIS